MKSYDKKENGAVETLRARKHELDSMWKNRTSRTLTTPEHDELQKINEYLDFNFSTK